MATRFYQSTIGKKAIVAVSGLVLFGFVVGHLAGNLQVFAGSERINDYGAFLAANPPLVWGTRILLLIAVFVHIWATMSLTRANRAARPVGYEGQQFSKASLPSRWMVWSGVFLAVYIVFHLLHLTVGAIHPDFRPLKIYENLVTGFGVLWVAIFYILAMIALGMHLYHGLWSVFQTLGLNHPKYNALRRVAATGVAVAIAGGYILIPLAVILGILK